MQDHILSWILFTPFLGMVAVLCAPRNNLSLVKTICLVATGIPLVLATILYFQVFDKTNPDIQCAEFFEWIPRGLLPPEPSTTLYASFFYSGIVLIGGLVGIWAGGVLADKYGQAKKSTYALIPAIGFALTTPFFILSLMTPSLIVIFLALMIPTALSLAWLGPVTSAFQHLVPPHMRATASAIFLFVNNLIGIGLGTYVLGALSDGFGARFGEESLRYAMLTGSTLYLVAGGLLFLTAPRLKHDWHG